MNTFSRMIRHLLTTTATGRRAFPPSTLKTIQATIAKGETQHRAEIRLIIEPALSLSAIVHGTSPRERARELFSQYRIWNTEENCGVLIYINLADHKIEIITDRTPSRIIAPKEWKALCQTMIQGFAHGAFHDSTIAGLEQLNALLIMHFPKNEGHSSSNQLSNKPLIL